MGDSVGDGIMSENVGDDVCDSVESECEIIEGHDIGSEVGCEEQNGEMFLSPNTTNGTGGTVVGSNNVSVVNHVEPPKIGMIFKSWQDVEAYYKSYAEQQGFGVTRAQGVYSKGEVRDRTATTWRCECWGRPDMRAMREAKKRAKAMDVSGSGGVVGGVVCADELSQRKRKSKKCECQAKVYASINRGGEWEIKKVELEHTHDATPRKASLVKEYRMKGLTSRARKRLLDFFEEGVPVSQIHGCFSAEIDGFDNLRFTVKDLAHEVYKARRLKMLGGDSRTLMTYFRKMQEGNKNFFHSIRIDPEGRLKDVIWVDGRCRAAYEEFGDVVCFDATYLTNAYELPFVNFVGVNHHGQTILLGCALVSHEDCDTFRWIFQQWLLCMNNKAPAAILTDQAAAMRKPLEEVMPATRHRWCIWHIMRKIPEKLGKCKGYKQFKPLLKAIVYERLTVDEFENGWSKLIRDYNLENNDWLSSLYTERHMWVPAYLRDYFWAGMKTTQRVESINSFFDGFVNRTTKLFEFPIKYAKAMEKRVRDETAADANCAKYVRRLVTGFKVEKFFQSLYTDTKFQEVQTECTRMMYCYCRESKLLAGNIIEYDVEDRVWIVPEGKSEEVITDRRRYFTATFNKDTLEVECQCRKFITHGIMCKHMMQILDKNHIVDIPERYVLRRWRKDILRKHTRVAVSYHDPNKYAATQRYNKLMSEFEELCDQAAMVNEDVVSLVSNALMNIRNEVLQCRNKKAAESLNLSFPDEATEPNCQPHTSRNTVWTANGPLHQDTLQSIEIDSDTDCPDVPPCGSTLVKDPIVTRKRRGRPAGSRNKTLAEMGFKKPCKKKQTTTEDSTKKAVPANAKSKVKGKTAAQKKPREPTKGIGAANNNKVVRRRGSGTVTRSSPGKSSATSNKAHKVKMLEDLVPIMSLSTKGKRKAASDTRINCPNKILCRERKKRA